MELSDHRNELEDWGLTRIEGFVARSAALKARQLIYDIAADYDLYTSDGWRHSSSRFGLDKSFRTAINALNSSNRFPDLFGDSAIQLTEELLGEPVIILPPGQQILFSLPVQGSWSIPHDVWHVDVPRLGEPGPPGLQLFTFVDDVEPEGGATLAVAGSHNLYNTSKTLRSKELKRLMGAETYFRRLFDPTRSPISSVDETLGRVDGIDLKVVELTGRIGDVYVMDLRTLHTPAENVSTKARIMLTCRLPRAAVAEKVL